MEWIKKVPPLNQRVFLWDIEQETATTGKLVDDEEYGSVISAYNSYYETKCFSHYAIIEPPID